MSDDRTYKEEVKHFGQIVDEFKNEVSSLKRTVTEGFDKLSQEINDIKKEQTIMTEGDSRHGVVPIRQRAEDAYDLANKVNQRVDKAKWIVIGLGAGAGVGGNILTDIIKKAIIGL